MAKAVPKRVRFEVLKRDLFRCAYCGRAAPEVILHVDHVAPRKGGGPNDMMNLVAACADCNQGKSAVPLSDSSAVEKQRSEIELAAARKEQIGLMARWARELAESKDAAHEAVVAALNKRLDTIGRHVSDHGRRTVAGWLRKYPLPDVLEAVDEAWRAHGVADQWRFWALVPHYARRIPQLREKPYLRGLFYAAAILRRRLGDAPRDLGKMLVDKLDDYVVGGLTVDEITAAARASGSWEEFLESMEMEVDTIEGVTATRRD